MTVTLGNDALPTWLVVGALVSADLPAWLVPFWAAWCRVNASPQLYEFHLWDSPASEAGIGRRVNTGILWDLVKATRSRPSQSNPVCIKWVIGLWPCVWVETSAPVFLRRGDDVGFLSSRLFRSFLGANGTFDFVFLVFSVILVLRAMPGHIGLYPSFKAKSQVRKRIPGSTAKGTRWVHRISELQFSSSQQQQPHPQALILRREYCEDPPIGGYDC